MTMVLFCIRRKGTSAALPGTEREVERMKDNRLMAFGMIRKGRSERCLMVVLDRRFPEVEAERGEGFLARSRRVFRLFPGAAARN